jgi:hypothetical protein
MTIFINGQQKQVPRPPLIDGLTVDEFVARRRLPIRNGQCSATRSNAGCSKNVSSNCLNL